MRAETVALDQALAGLSVELRQSAPIPLAAQFDCAAGELLALVGPSGSGKTTLLRAIAGLYRVSRGRIACAGQVWFDSAAGLCLRPQTRRVGLVFQQYALFPHMSAQRNVELALGHVPAPARPARAAALLARVHLGGLERRLPRELSGGQQQRVAVARALARDPAVLLLDEPFSAVDQVTRGKLQRELVRLRESLRIPIVLVTHDLDEARLLADRMAIVHRGATLQVGPPEQVLVRPASADVARLVELTNLFHGRISGAASDGRLYLRWRGYVLEARAQPGFSVGQDVEWAVHSQFVLLHRRDRPSRGERENPVEGICTGCVVVGDSAAITLAVDGEDAVPLSFRVPAHVARRNAITPGERVSVSLLAEGVQLLQPSTGALASPPRID